ncbi:MAG: transposase family protein [Myxococcales bacterium]|nr:transposase family protein [Myxococcales bacterium]
MDSILRGHEALCLFAIRLLLRLALAVEEHRRRLPRRTRRWLGSLRRLYRRWLVHEALVPPPPFPRRWRAWNRTPGHLEEKVVRLHVEQPRLGAGQLMRLCERVLGFHAVRETFRQILIRRQDLVLALQGERRSRPRRISVRRRGQLWGLDMTLVWLLGFWPVWVLGAVDYFGSRLVAFEPLAWPSGAEVVRVLAAAFDGYGVPERLLTDRGPAFTSAAFQQLCAVRGVRHVLTRPAHPWTNGRIERVFRTFKSTVFGFIWLFDSAEQVERYCAEFMAWYNAHRPHSSFGGRTPDEVFFGRPRQLHPLGRISFFDGHLRWWRFGPG